MKYDWPRLLSNSAIILGVALVVYELDQNRQLALDQARLDDFIAMQAFENTLMGDNPTAAIVKARNSPNELTPEKAMVVDAYFDSILTRFDSYEFISIFANFQANPGPMLQYDFDKYFNFEYARTWWEREKEYGALSRVSITRAFDDYFARNPSFK